MNGEVCCGQTAAGKAVMTTQCCRPLRAFAPNSTGFPCFSRLYMAVKYPVLVETV